jgi:hypothetical protein
VIFDLIRALLGALVVGVLPGCSWAAFLGRHGGLAEWLACSAAVSMASVPPIALALARAFGTGVTLPVALGAVASVAGSGLLACRMKGRPGEATGPVLPRPDGIRDGRVLALVLVALGLALAAMLGRPAPGWLLITLLAALRWWLSARRRPALCPSRAGMWMVPTRARSGARPASRPCRAAHRPAS